MLGSIFLSLSIETIRAEEKIDTAYEGKTVRKWLKALGDTSTNQGRNKALEVLDKYCNEVEDGIATLLVALKDPDEEVRTGVLRIFRERANDKVAIPAIVRALKSDKSDGVRLCAVCALSEMAPNDEAVVDALLLALLNDKYSEVRVMAAYRFRCMNKKPKAAVDPLMHALKDKDGKVRVQAAYAVAGLEESEKRLPALMAAFKDVDQDSLHGIASAVGGIGLPALPTLRASLESKEASQRSGAAMALSCMRADVPQARKSLKELVPAVAGLLHDKNNLVRENAAHALAGMVEEGAPVIQELIGALKDTEPGVRVWCVLALRRLGPGAAPAVPALIQTLEDKESGIRASSAETLGRIGAKAKQAVPALIRTLKDKEDHVRWSACDGLGGLGKDARAAIPALKEATKDKDRELRKRATEALKLIESDGTSETIQ
jgi:HEAT repeat protein